MQNAAVEKTDGENAPTVLVLTPIKNAAPFLPRYVELLQSLTYPHQRISVGILESDSTDGSHTAARAALDRLDGDFCRIGLWKRDFGYQIPPNTPRWANRIQVERRTVLARSRNHLLFHALADEDWVLWLDVDLVEYPPDLIDRMLATGKDIVQPHCVRQYGGPTFDLNAWRDKGRLHMDDLRSEGPLVRLHAVGGTVLLVRADLHRDGLIYPAFRYGLHNPLIRRPHQLTDWRHLIVQDVKRLLRGRIREMQIFDPWVSGELETEGLGMMAHDMGHECWGMPHLEVRHIDA